MSSPGEDSAAGDRTFRAYLLLFGKGLCMGAADIVPGVSGGTMALILGIYRELIHSLRNLTGDWVASVIQRFRSGDPTPREGWLALARSMNLPFLVVLGLGILTALVMGGWILPPLMAEYPVMVRSFFFGLILASIPVPLANMKLDDRSRWLRVLGWGILAGLIGFWISNPARSPIRIHQWVPLESSGESLVGLVQRGPSGMSPRRVLWSPKNRKLRGRLRKSGLALPRPRGSQSASHTSEPEAERTNPGVDIPRGWTVYVPQPPLWFVGISGAIAISAMILPGISGSYILLILGSYLFVLNALRGVVKGLGTGAIWWTHWINLGLFAVGAVAGLLVFTRILDYFLSHRGLSTMAFLTGLMAGCLRGVWPFQKVIPEEGAALNVLPTPVSSQFLGAVIICSLAAGIVVLLRRLGQQSSLGVEP